MYVVEQQTASIFSIEGLWCSVPLEWYTAPGFHGVTTLRLQSDCSNLDVQEKLALIKPSCTSESILIVKLLLVPRTYKMPLM